MMLMLSPQDCSGVDTLTRKYRCRVATLSSFYDLMFIAALVLDALFLCSEVLVLEKELLVDTALTRSIRLAITIIRMRCVRCNSSSYNNKKVM
jgi:hypothetical protein